MWKTVILLDTPMPESCIECAFFNGFECKLTGDTIESVNDRLSTCQLRQLPYKYISVIKGDEYGKGKAEGWNACLDAIIGETE